MGDWQGGLSATRGSDPDGVGKSICPMAHRAMSSSMVWIAVPQEPSQKAGLLCTRSGGNSVAHHGY